MLLLGRHDGGILSSLVEFADGHFCSAAGSLQSRRSPSSHGDLASANECKPGLHRLLTCRSRQFVVPPTSSRTRPPTALEV